MRLFIAFLTSLILLTTAFADVPTKINYQGRLTNSSGDPIDTTITMVFSICNDSAATICVWGESQPNVEVVNGIFTVDLGAVSPISESVFELDNRWLHVVVGSPGGEPIEPPIKLVTTPYAFHAARADTANYALASGAKGLMSSPAYNSEWQILEAGSLKEIYHNLNQDPDNMFIDIQRKSSKEGISNIQGQNEKGQYQDLNSSSVKVYRSETDECNMVRVRIWLIQ